jgi:hypothetical protein
VEAPSTDLAVEELRAQSRKLCFDFFIVYFPFCYIIIFFYAFVALSLPKIFSLELCFTNDYNSALRFMRLK